MQNPPIFNFGTMMIPRDSLEDFIFILSEKNLNRLKSISSFSGLFTDSKIVNFIFAVCDRLEFNTEVKHAALALFDVFMLLHVETLYNHTIENDSKRVQAKDWQFLEDKIASQLTLRVLTCVQIATKLHFLPLSMSMGTIREFLRKLGHCYSHESVVNSELRVLKTLDYKINIDSPLLYIETLLHLIKDSSLDLDRLYFWCVQILNFVTLERDEIYQLLIETTSKAKFVDRRQMVWVQNDYMLLAATVITTASYVFLGFDTAEKIAEVLHDITQIPSQDITDFCTVIVNLVNCQNVQR